MRIFIFIFSFVFLLGCKTNKKFDYGNKFQIEDTLFENSESETHSINSSFKSIEQKKTILIIYNKRKISFEKFQGMINKPDSNYTFNIIKNKIKLKRYGINKKFKTLIIINKAHNKK